MRTSSLNDANMEPDMKEHTYHFLAMALDHFYGLKMDQEVDSYYTLLEQYADDMLTRTDSTMYKTINELANIGLNDIHTSHFGPGYYVSPTYEIVNDSLSDFGERTQNFYTTIWDTQDYIEAAGMTYNAMPTHRVIDDGKTAVIYLTGFNIDSPGEFKKTLDLLPGTVENIVVDLAYNTGGNVGAVWRIFGYITEEQFMYHGMNPADGSGYTLYYTSDYVAYDEYNYFFTVSGVTFSAGNLMTVMAKELGYPVLGSQTGGGAASIGVLSLPNGSVMIISKNSLTAARVGNEIDGYEYLSTEFGVQPDIFVSNPYDDAQLIAAIEEYFASQE
jgi:predicted transcriptional regulator